jgi:hypothetical protein
MDGHSEYFGRGGDPSRVDHTDRVVGVVECLSNRIGVAAGRFQANLDLTQVLLAQPAQQLLMTSRR